MQRHLQSLALAASVMIFACTAAAQEPADDPDLPPRPPAEAEQPPGDLDDQPVPAVPLSEGVIVPGVGVPGAVVAAPACPTHYPAYWTAGYLWPYPQPYPPGYTAMYAFPFSSLACPVYDWPCGYGGFVGGHAGYAPLYPYASYPPGYTGAWHPGYCGPVCLGW